MSITIKFNGTKYQVKLSNDFENYYVVGNKINLLLISHLLKKQHNVNCDEITGIYDLDIIDHNVNMKTFNQNDEITFGEENYSVAPFIYVDTSIVTVLDIINKSLENADNSTMNDPTLESSL